MSATTRVPSRPAALASLIAVVLLPLLGAARAADGVPPVTGSVWQEAVVSVLDLDRSAAFFIDIGGYETRWRGPLDSAEIATWGLPAGASGEAMLLGPAGYDSGLVRLVRFDNAGRQEPMRPGSRAWDTGCYFSLMVRMKDMQAIYDDAIRLGWWTETPITYLEFGSSRLNVVIFKGPYGLQLQGYERLSPALPEAIPAFERMTGPFNVMQMVSDRDRAYRFFTEVLGFDTFYLGKPYTAEEPTPMPLGIPVNLTTSVPYRAGIVYPQPGEFGRMEMIEIMGLDGNDFSDRCVAPNLGILAIRFPVDDLDRVRQLLESRGRTTGDPDFFDLPPYGRLGTVDVRTPDGALIQLYEKASQ